MTCTDPDIPLMIAAIVAIALVVFLLYLNTRKEVENNHLRNELVNMNVHFTQFTAENSPAINYERGYREGLAKRDDILTKGGDNL